MPGIAGAATAVVVGHLAAGTAKIRVGAHGVMLPPVDDIEIYWASPERAQASRMLACSIAGSADMMRPGLERLTGADELMVTAAVQDHDARLRSYEILAEVARSLDAAAGGGSV